MSYIGKNSAKPSEFDECEKLPDPIEYLECQKVSCFVHFTSIENLPQICLSRELSTKAVMDIRLGGWPKDPGGTEESRERDKCCGTWDMVPLSFTHRTLMAYRLKREMHLCCFAVRLETIYKPKAKVTTTNSTSGADHIDALDGIRDVEYWAMRAAYKDWKSDKWKKAWRRNIQAEVLIPGRIGFEDILHVGFVSQASLDEGKRMSAPELYFGDWGIDFVVEPKYFSDRPKAVDIGFPYLDQVEISDTLYATVCPGNSEAKIWCAFTQYPPLPKIFPSQAPSNLLFEGTVEPYSRKYYVPKEHVPSDGGFVTIYLGDDQKKVRWATLPWKQGKPIEKSPEFSYVRRVSLTRLSKSPTPKFFQNVSGEPELPRKESNQSGPSPAVSQPEPPAPRFSHEESRRILDRFYGSIVLCAAGDALGWPTEFLKPSSDKKPPFSLPLRNFASWAKHTGGRWWGYCLNIRAGEYSDDTQLNLAVSRCISPIGDFMPEKFAYRELPMWLQYEFGGGRSVKAAASALIEKTADWIHNFYRKGELSYCDAGGNGAAMRNLPISLVGVGDEKRMYRDSICNTIITHGHPHALLGTILMACATRQSILGSDRSHLTDCLRSGLEDAENLLKSDDSLQLWAKSWERKAEQEAGSFFKTFAESKAQALGYLADIQRFRNKENLGFFEHIGAFNSSTRGSGIVSACAAVYLSIKEYESPSEPVIAAANMLGSDTDTIAAFVGAIIGARHGSESIPVRWREQLQDYDYIRGTASRIHAIAVSPEKARGEEFVSTEPEDSYRKILEWETGGYRRLFDESVEIMATISHPTLGTGTISDISDLECSCKGYRAKAIRVNFVSGQSCTFHSRILRGISSSLLPRVTRALRN